MKSLSLLPHVREQTSCYGSLGRQEYFDRTALTYGIPFTIPMITQNH